MHITGSKKYLEYAGNLPGINLDEHFFFGMLDILPFHVNCDYNEVSHLNDKE
jgi:hypothetical protein